MRTSLSFNSPALRRVSFSLLVGLIAGSLLLIAGCDSNGGNGSDDESTITEIAQNDDRFSILAGLVVEEGLNSNLSAEDASLTVFAPTDQAFLDALDDNDNGTIDDDEVPDDVGSILKFHVVDGVFYAADEPTAPSGTQIPDGQTTPVPTLEGTDVTVERSGSDVKIKNPGGDDASVVEPDVDAENGVVHGIDTVLLP